MQVSCLLPDNINALIQRPVCPKCRAHMLLTRIAPARLGFDFHTFECAQCDRIREVMVASDAFQHVHESSIWHDRATEVAAETSKMPLGKPRRTAFKEANICAGGVLQALSVERGDPDWGHGRSPKPIPKGGY